MSGISVMQKLVVDLYDYMDIMKYEGHLPLDTHEWKQVLFPYPSGPNGMTESNTEALEKAFNEVVELANVSFPTYSFELVKDFSDISSRSYASNLYWLKYTLKPEHQD